MEYTQAFKEIDPAQDRPLCPNYMSFNNENIFLGSYNGLRFKLSPNVEDTHHFGGILVRSPVL